MDLKVDGFDWDDGNRTKCQKHRVSINQIEALFQGAPRIAPDPKHSTGEDRSLAVESVEGRAMFVAFTIHMKDARRLIRPVSARFIYAREVEAYEKESTPT